MEFTDIFPPELGGSSLEEALSDLHRLYAEADAACANFLSSARASSPGFGCPEGCGACCERFVPDILPAEADYAALWILRYRPDLAGVEPGESAPCPFYAADRPEAHCQIYGGRPLICRLFGYTAMATKTGSPCYSLCWSMPGIAGENTRSWEGAGLERVFGATPALMADFGLRLQSISNPASAERPFLGRAIRDSIDRLRFLIGLAGGGNDGGNNNGGSDGNSGGRAA
jgi:Fe-S-cluster containining protein